MERLITKSNVCESNEAKSTSSLRYGVRDSYNILLSSVTMCEQVNLKYKALVS